MAKLAATRTSQDVLCAEFIFNYNDTAKDSVSGTDKTFGSTFTDNIVFDAINLPSGCQILGGDLVIETAGAGPTAYTIAIGTAAAPAAYLAATSLSTAAGTRTALLLTAPLGSVGGANVRVTVASTVANATAGKARITVMYKLDGRGGREVTPV